MVPAAASQIPVPERVKDGHELAGAPPPLRDQGGPLRLTGQSPPELALQVHEERLDAISRPRPELVIARREHRRSPADVPLGRAQRLADELAKVQIHRLPITGIIRVAPADIHV